MRTLLIVEDDHTIAFPLYDLLLPLFDKVKVAQSLDVAYEHLSKNFFDMVIIDRILPDGDGVELIKYLKEESFETKILILSQKIEVKDRLLGLESGADDYLPKPFASQEVLLKVEKLLHFKRILQQHNYLWPHIQFFFDEAKLVVDGTPIKLRKKEAKIFHCFCLYSEQIIKREQIINYTWRGKDFIPEFVTLDVYLKRLRMHLGKYANRLVTVRGCGYKFLPI